MIMLTAVKPTVATTTITIMTMIMKLVMVRKQNIIILIMIMKLVMVRKKI